MRKKPNNARKAKPHELVAAAVQIGTGVRFSYGYAFLTKEEAENWARGNAYIVQNPLTDEWLVLYPKR